MPAISNSSAFRNAERVLPQHQAALTLLQARLSTPGIQVLSWLNLACGRGQILVSLEDNLSAEARAKIDYWAFDLDQDYARETQKTAERLSFASLQSKVGDLSDFDQLLPTNARYDFITLTNTVHEIDPARLAGLLVSCIVRLTDTGTLFIYDMEQVKPPELGAVPWSRDDIKRLVRCMLDALGATAYRPEVGLWNHRSCNGWNVQLERQHLGISPTDVVGRVDTATDATREEVSHLLEQRLVECRATLERLTQYGAETVEEQEDKERLLYEFWALSRAMEDRQ